MQEKINELGAFLVERLQLGKAGREKQGLQEEILALSNGSKSAVKEYYVRKVLAVLTVLSAGLVLTLICFLAFRQSSGVSNLESVLRPGYGEGDAETALSVQVEDNDTVQEVEFTVQERRYTEEQLQEFLDQAIAELEENLLGENQSLDFVQKDLVFPQSLSDGLVSVSWTTDPYDVIDDDGSILEAEEEDGILVEIQAFLSCGDLEAGYSVCARVFPPDLTEEELLLAAIQAEVQRADEETVCESELILPISAGGKTLTWLETSKNPYLIVLLFTLVLSVGIYLEMDSRVHEKAEKRKNQLLLDYPDLMWKMTMLLGAGMNIRSVFMRIAEEYMRGQKQTRPRYVYEEVVRTCNEMRSGIGEAQAYERFGKRCQLPSYIRIGSVLSQNLRKGAMGLTALLESEAEASLSDRKNHARKIGEQTGTKLLLPMGLMLIIVLAVLMVPAFLSL